MKKAVLVIDLQNDYFTGGKFPLWNTEQTLNNIDTLVRKANSEEVPVILVQHVADSSAGISPFFNEGTEGAAIHPHILEVVPNAPVITKAYADSFYKTNLEALLEELAVEEIIVCGMMTQNCVTHTAISKSAEKYSVKIVQECCTSVDEMIHMIGLHAISTRVSFVGIGEAL